MANSKWDKYIVTDEVDETSKPTASKWDKYIVKEEEPVEPTVEEPVQRERTAREYIMPAGLTKYEEKPGERTLLGDIFERPASAIRSGLLSKEGFVKGYKKGSILPEEVPTFKNLLRNKYSKTLGKDLGKQEGEKPTWIERARDYNIRKSEQEVGWMGDILDTITNPAELLTLFASKAKIEKETVKGAYKAVPGAAKKALVSLKPSVRRMRKTSKTISNIGNKAEKSSAELNKLRESITIATKDPKVAQSFSRTFEKQIGPLAERLEDQRNIAVISKFVDGAPLKETLKAQLLNYLKKDALKGEGLIAKFKTLPLSQKAIVLGAGKEAFDQIKKFLGNL